MAAAGRAPAGERDTPPIAQTITHGHEHHTADESVHVENVITCPHPMGQTPGSALPPIANTITKAGPNK